MIELSVLREIGFSQGEISVYEALLRKGELTIGPLVKEAKITASKSYQILDKLKQKGLVSTTFKQNTRHFLAMHPERIIEYIDKKEKAIHDHKEQVKAIIPQILKQRQQTHEQYSTTYEGYESIKTVFEEAISTLSKTKDPLLGFSLGVENEYDQARKFFETYDRKRKMSGVMLHLIAPETQRPFFSSLGKERGIKSRYLQQAVPTGTILFGDNVVHLLWSEEPVAFVIHSAKNAQAYKQFFNALWKQAKQ